MRINTDLHKKSEIKFLVGGSLTFLAEYITFYVFYIFFKWVLLLANSLSFGIGLTISFTLNRKWAFRQTAYQRKFHHQALIYIVLAASNLLVNNVIVGGLKSAGLDPRIGKVLAIAVIAAWNLFIYKHIIFKEKLESS